MTASSTSRWRALALALPLIGLVAATAAAQAPRTATPPPAARPGASPAAARPAAAPAAARPAGALERAVQLDRVVAVVNDEAITDWEISEQKRIVRGQMAAQKVAPPAPDVLEKQVLDRIITERVLLQHAKETGVRVDDVQVERTIQRIAQDNKLSAEAFRQAVEREGMTYAKYRENLRNEIVIQRLRDREVDARIAVSDAEIDNLLATLASQAGGDTEFRVSHILVGVPERATPGQIEARKQRAEEALKRVRDGGDFAQIAAGFSDASDALQGGSLGWRTAARLPTVFVESVRTLKPGEASEVLRSAAGFHIVKLEETRGRSAPTVVEQTRVQHILVKVNETTSESEGRIRIDRIKERIDTGSRFEDQAKLNSEDGSAPKGGDLGWISPGDTVPEFEAAMNKLQVDEISAPVRSPFGWHLIQVKQRRTQDITADRQREQARMAIRQRKSDEGFQDWVRQLRDRAYVEFLSDER
ncbi:MAG: peptidylprolyl isomerase [Betaproteobacteria bacterium]|nr:peptidylprolyl isomerase [Betaproteobacteria bacterium]